MYLQNICMCGYHCSVSVPVIYTMIHTLSTMPPFIPRPSISRSTSETLPNVIDVSSSDGSLTDICPSSRHEDLHTSKRRKLGQSDNTSLSGKPPAGFSGAFETEKLGLQQGDDARFNNDLDDNVDEDSDEDIEDEVDWEDAIYPGPPNHPVEPSGDLELTLDKGAYVETLTDVRNKKKGHSKIEKQIRVSAHCMHVQFLLFHNLIRNGWSCDKEVQAILIDQLPKSTMAQVEKWRRVSRFSKTDESLLAKGRKDRAQESIQGNNSRDWGSAAATLEDGIPDMSRGDPLISLLRILTGYWRKRFTITAPGLRKQGYKPLPRLEAEIEAFKSNPYDAEKHGERLESIQDFRNSAKSCEGSRDLGSQLFTALIRGLGIEARLVASLQPIGFGWGKVEEAILNEPNKLASPHLNKEAVITPSDKGAKTSRPKAQRRDSKLNGQKDKLQNAIQDDNSAGSPLSDEESVVEVIPPSALENGKKLYDQDIQFPTYWTEVISPIQSEIYAVDPHVLCPPVISTSQEHLALFEPRGAQADKAKQVFAYVIAFSSEGTAKDVTRRYLKRHEWPGRTKGFRLPPEKVPIYNNQGKVIRYEEYDWFKTVMSGYVRTQAMRNTLDDVEDAKDLRPLEEKKEEKNEIPETLQSFKTSAHFVLERHLRREEVIMPGSKPVKTFLYRKRNGATEEPVYHRRDVLACKTSESWHKAGRQIKNGEQPMKMVPVRAMTLNRKREVEEAEREGGEKLKQGLYALDQTEWIIPPPIENGNIPKNAYGNMDCFVSSMVPQGAVHIPLNSTAKICKKLGIDFAEACIGFEFGKQRAVPIIQGVVVAEEHSDLVMDEWDKDEEERKRKSDSKREKAVLVAWKKMLVGLRIMKRVREDYGGDGNGHLREEMNPFTNKKYRPTWESHGNQEDGNQIGENLAGGFVIDEAEKAEGRSNGGGFLIDEAEEGDGRTNRGGIFADEAEAAGEGPNVDGLMNGKNLFSKQGSCMIGSEATRKIPSSNPTVTPMISFEEELDVEGNGGAKTRTFSAHGAPESGQLRKAERAEPLTANLAQLSPRKLKYGRKQSITGSHMEDSPPLNDNSSALLDSNILVRKRKTDIKYSRKKSAEMSPYFQRESKITAREDDIMDDNSESIPQIISSSPISSKMGEHKSPSHPSNSQPEERTDPNTPKCKTRRPRKNGETPEMRPYTRRGGTNIAKDEIMAESPEIRHDCDTPRRRSGRKKKNEPGHYFFWKSLQNLSDSDVEVMKEETEGEDDSEVAAAPIPRKLPSKRKRVSPETRSSNKSRYFRRRQENGRRDADDQASVSPDIISISSTSPSHLNGRVSVPRLGSAEWQL